MPFRTDGERQGLQADVGGPAVQITSNKIEQFSVVTTKNNVTPVRARPAATLLLTTICVVRSRSLRGICQYPVGTHNYNMFMSRAKYNDMHDDIYSKPGSADMVSIDNERTSVKVS